MGLLKYSRSSLVIGVAVIAAGCQTLQIRDIRRDDVWPDNELRRGNTNATDATVSPPLTEVWVYDANGAFGPAQPLLVGDFVIVVNRKGEVHAIERDSGKRIGIEKLGNAINGSPTLSGGTLYVPLDYGSKHAIAAYDLREGRARWTTREGDAISTSVAAADELLFTVDRGSRLVARSEDGAVVWDRMLSSDAPVYASPVADGSGGLLIASNEGLLERVLRADGRTLWTSGVAAPIYQTPAVSGDAIVVADTRGSLSVHNLSNGSTRWRRQVADPEVKLTSPATDGRSVAVAGTDGMVRLFDSGRGDEEWSTPVGAPIVAAPLLTDRFVYVGTLDARVVAIDRGSGATVWEAPVRGRIKSAMAAAGTSIFVLTEPRFVYRFSEGAAEEGGIADAD